MFTWERSRNVKGIEKEELAWMLWVVTEVLGRGGLRGDEVDVGWVGGSPGSQNNSLRGNWCFRKGCNVSRYCWLYS